MESKRKTFLLLLIALAMTSTLFACSRTPALDAGVASPAATLPRPSPQALATVQPDDTPSPDMPQASAAAPVGPAFPELPFTRYKLSALLDYEGHRLSVDQSIAYVNHTGLELPDLLLLVEPNRYPGSFTLSEIAWEDGQPVSGYSLTGAQLHIPLPAPLPAGGSLGLSLSYEQVLPNQNQPYGYTERQTNLGDWYPYLPPYMAGEGWLVREDAFYGEHLAYEMADFEVEIRLASPETSSGENLVVAASARPRVEGGVYRYTLEAARNFAWTVSHLYQVQEARAGDVAVTAYAFPFHPAADGPALQATVSALNVFSDLFSPYPRQGLAVVEADFLDGMEYDGLFFLSHAFYDFYTGDEKSNLVIIAAHETAHQWWYGRVGNDQANEPWLDEALSTYSELLFYENAYPQLASWWWENRINFHDPQGWVDETIYQASGFYPYRNAVYLRGAQFLGELRQVMGDEAFFAFLRDYLARFTYRQATTDDFFALLREHTDADLSAIVAAYFANR
jgi:hypothetical protein